MLRLVLIPIVAVVAGVLGRLIAALPVVGAILSRLVAAVAGGFVACHGR